MGLVLALSGSSLAMDPSGKDGVRSSSGELADYSPSITWEDVQTIEKRIEVLKRLGRTGEAEELERQVAEWKEIAVPAPKRESVPEGALGGAVEATQPGRSALAYSPWGQDQIIYQGDYSYNSWATIERNQPYSVDYDSLGNIYAAVILADSTIHVFESTDNGVTWTDEYSITPSPKAFMTNVQLIVSDDGDSALAYLFYLWTGGQGNNLWCNVADMNTWTWLREALLDDNSADTIVDFSATRDQYFGGNYIVYCDYQEGENSQNPTIKFTRTGNHGATWSTPQSMQANSADPCLAYGGYGSGGNLYRGYTWQPDVTDSKINMRRSTNYGVTWSGSITIRDGSLGDNTDPQVAAAHLPRASQLVWTTLTHDWQNSGNLQVWANYSDDGGGTWSSATGPSYDVDADEYGSSIHVYRSDGNDFFHLAYIYDDTATTTLDSIRIQSTDSTAWPGSSTSLGINDSAYAANTRPLATYSTGFPGVAYGGAGGVNVYYDNAWYVGAEESGVKARNLRFELLQNRPNPFSDVTTLHYTLPMKSTVSLKIYDITGRLVRTLVDGAQDAGVHAVVWDGTDESGNRLSTGVYFSRLSGRNGVRTSKLSLID